MIRKLTLSFAAFLATIGFIACNSDSDSNGNVQLTTTCAAVKTFNLQEDDDILVNLDSVFFSIDLIKGEIYNADSMPYGTKIKELVPVITTFEGASVAELTVKRAGKSDTIYDYLLNSTDTLDFSNPVNLRLVSPDGTVERNYTIRVNVHQQKPDSLTWARSARTPLPSLFAYPNEQHTVGQDSTIHCLTRFGSEYCIASGDGLGEWNMRNVSFPVEVDINSFNASDDALYILSTTGELYSSTDGSEWTATGTKYDYLYGGYESSLLGVVKIDGKWMIQQYPEMTTIPLLEGMPVSGTSNPLIHSFKMSGMPQFLLVGGRKANGSLSKATWGFDGTSWAKISKRDMPEALEGMAVVAYYTFSRTSTFAFKSYPTLIAFGGRKADGTLSKKVYISKDYGFNWDEANSQMQLPSYIPAMYNFQAFVVVNTMNASSRVSKPIESWECPYIYLYGGIGVSTTTYNTVWCGAINRLIFKPIQ